MRHHAQQPLKFLFRFDLERGYAAGALQTRSLAAKCAADMMAACANGLALVFFQLRHVSMFDWVTKVWQTTPEEEVPGALFMLCFFLRHDDA